MGLSTSESDDTVLRTSGRDTVLLTRGRDTVLLTSGRDPILPTSGRDTVLLTSGTARGPGPASAAPCARRGGRVRTVDVTAAAGWRRSSPLSHGSSSRLERRRTLSDTASRCYHTVSSTVCHGVLRLAMGPAASRWHHWLATIYRVVYVLQHARRRTPALRPLPPQIAYRIHYIIYMIIYHIYITGMYSIQLVTSYTSTYGALTGYVLVASRDRPTTHRQQGAPRRLPIRS